MKEREFNIRKSLQVGRPVDESDPINQSMPKGLKHLIVFSAATFVGSATALFIDPTGLMVGVLAVVILEQKSHVRR